MSNKPKSLMTLYSEGCLISRDLQDMMVDYAADARFDREMHDEVDLYADRLAGQRYHRPSKAVVAA